MLPFEKIKRTVLERTKTRTSAKFGKKPSARSVAELIEYGIVNIDKPAGPTSHQVSAYTQKILGVNKGGHSGTLDPKVTGCLPIALGRGTRIVQALLPSGKEYICMMHLHKEVEQKKLETVMREFVGKIKQLPPIKSAVKRAWRFRKIYYMELLDKEEKEVLFKVGCQAGTYIRKLVHDMGQRLGTGAHMAELRRTKAGPFSEDTLVTLQDLIDAVHYYKKGNEKFIRKIIKPLEFGVAHLPKVWVMDTTVDTLCHGASLKVPGIAKVETDIQVGEMVAVMTLKEELVGFGTTRMISRDLIKTKGLAVKMDKVFMLPGVYPRVDK